MKRSNSFSSDEEPDFEPLAGTTSTSTGPKASRKPKAPSASSSAKGKSPSASAHHVSKKIILETAAPTSAASPSVSVATPVPVPASLASPAGAASSTASPLAVIAADKASFTPSPNHVFFSDDESGGSDTDDGSSSGKKSASAAAKSAGKLLRQARRNERRLAAKTKSGNGSDTDTQQANPATPSTAAPEPMSSTDPLYPPSSQPPTPQSMNTAPTSFLLSPSSPYTAVYGADARPSLEFKLEEFFRNSNTSYLKLKDIQDLVCWVLADGVNQRWVFVKNKPLIKKVVVVLLNNISPGIYSHYHQCFKFLPARFSLAIPTKCPGSKNRVFSPVHSLLNVPLIKIINKHKKAKAEAEGRKEESAEDAHPRSTYFLSVEQMRSHGYPLKAALTADAAAAATFHNYILHGDTDSLDNVGRDQAPLFALDCEMCKSAEGFELARLSIVDEKLNVLYDEYIKPANEILDYCTKYSGITAEHLKDVQTSLADAQAAIQRIVPKHGILVGHSLENDLKVLKMIHHNVIDTALIYSHTRGTNFKPSLRWLAETYLKRVIQADEAGHDPTEDAMACMELVLLKLKKGPSFGIHEEETESLFLRMSRSGKNSTIIDRPAIVRQHSMGSVNCVAVNSDDEALESTLKAIRSSTDFVYTHFHTLETFFMYPETPGPVDEELLKKHLARFDHYAKTIFEACIPDSLVVFYTGHGPIDELRKLQQEKEALGTKWTDAQERALELETMKTRDSLSFIAIK